MNTYVCDIDLIGSETERPFARVYAVGETPDEALAAARLRLDEGEALRETATPLQEILEEVLRRPEDFTIDWKHEGRYGPVTLTDATKLPDVEPNEQGARVYSVPFGSDPEWSISLPWSTRAEAKRLAKYLGLTLGES